MINFPQNPVLNQVFTLGVKTWKWNGRAWDLQAISDVQVQRAEDAAVSAEASATSAATSLAAFQAIYANVRTFGAKGDGVTDDTGAIQGAIDYVASHGGGVVDFPPGTYIVNRNNPADPNGSNPTDRALQIMSSRITLRGVSGASRILHKPNTAKRFILLGVGKLPIVNGGLELTDITIEGLEFDGNYQIPAAAGNVADDGNALLWLHGVQRLTLRDLYLHNSSDYGIGIENGGHKDFRLENIVIEDVMADGIDVKNNGDTDGGNKMVNITVRRFGRGYNTSEPFAGIDIMGPGWELSNIHISEYGDLGTPNAGVRFKQGEIGESRGEAGNYSSLSNFYIRGAGVANVYASATGVKVSARYVSVSNGTIRECMAEGMLIEQQESKVSNVTVLNCSDGFRARNYSYTTNGDRITFANCTARGNTHGFVFETQACMAVNCVAIANGTNVHFNGAGSLNNRWLGGVIQDATVTQVKNAGTGNVIRNAYGFATSAQVESAAIDIATTGDKAVLIPHGLPFTPSRVACQISLLRSANNVTWVISRMMVVGVDATNVTCRLGITTASPTAGDTATLALQMDASLLPAL